MPFLPPNQQRQSTEGISNEKNIETIDLYQNYFSRGVGTGSRLLPQLLGHWTSAIPTFTGGSHQYSFISALYQI